MEFHDLGILGYRDAWAVQERHHAEVVAGGPNRVLLVEHPPTITYGRRPGVDRNVVAPAEQLAKLGVDVVPSDRGGDVTFHGLGQLVAYPILRLADFGLSVGGYVHALEDVIIAALAEWGVVGQKDPAAVGVWTGGAKIAAIGVRIRRGVSMHGLALNVTTDLNYFQLIVPCGLTGRAVTSLQRVLGERVPSGDAVRAGLKRAINGRFEVTLHSRGREPAGLVDPEETAGLRPRL